MLSFYTDVNLNVKQSLCLDCRILESLSLEKISDIFQSNHKPSTTAMFSCVLKCHIHTVYEHFQAWWLHTPPRQPVPTLYNPVHEHVFPDIQSEPPLVQLETVRSCLVAYYLSKESDSHLTATSSIVESSKVPPSLNFPRSRPSSRILV